MVLFLEASTWESGECWTAVCRCSNISLQLMHSNYEAVIRLLGTQNTVWVTQEMLLIPILQWKQLPFCCKQCQISSSFVLNGTVNCIASLNSRLLQQHAHQLGAKKVLKWMKIKSGHVDNCSCTGSLVSLRFSQQISCPLVDVIAL